MRHPSPAGPGPAVQVVAHRGASTDAPENTLAAVDEALAQGADSIEVDLQRTADGQLVLLHDTTLARTTDVARVLPDRAAEPVGTFTLAELKRLDAGSWFGPGFAGEPVPTLGELLARVGDRAGLLIELKDPASYPGIEQQVADAVGAPRADVAVQSFDHDALRRFAAAAPDVPAGLLFDSRPTDAELDAAAAVADQVNPSFRVTDAALVAAVRARGMETGVYTVNTGADLRRMIDAGVHRIITDVPGALRALLG
ncbi:glycerophosphodiester phosphodiesterase family protein [Pseudonocardia sp. NPDC046786]|uniref:glycerophosphodiester phosphodiesterase n=1 Tax=Pseudonocardia sp. NPDC046786 TaxID=3155471 RepID=UPI0033EEDFA8